MNEVDDTANNPLLDFSIKLCAAVKKEKCLHDRTSVRKKNTTPDIEAAWERVAKECSETIEYCKYRWKSMYKSFFRNFKRCNHYYLHDHMLFLQEGAQQETMNDDINDDISRQESEFDATQLDEDKGSESDSQTVSADEMNVNVKDKKKSGMFLTEENEQDASDVESLGTRKRSRHQRACKRGLDPKLVSELAEESPEEKRPRRSLEKTKSLTQLKEKGHTLKVEIRPVRLKQINKHFYTDIDETKVDTANAFSMSRSLKMVDAFTNTEVKHHHSSTQYELLESSLSPLDEMFIDTLRSQLSKMNGRQKMNFKSKIYQSLMDVFDDATDFPHSKECIKVPPKGAPLLVNTTTGELRLMRELVSLVQAAKSTPEIITAKDKVMTTTVSKSPVKAKTIAGNDSSEISLNSQVNSTPSDSFEDDEDIDLNLPAENPEEEDDSHLPRSLDEIMAKPGDNREPVRGNNVVGLPKHVLQKVVRVSGSNGSTIVAHDGDKRRIYRIYPKSVHPVDSRLMVNKNPNSVGTFYVAPPKPGAPANSTALNKTSNTAPIITVKNFANKAANVSNAYPTSVGNNANQNAYNTTTKRVNSPALYKSIHPSNRILNASTGLFQDGPSGNSPSPPPNSGKTAQASSQALTSSGGATTTPKLVPMKSPMLPPNSNAAAGYSSKKTLQVRSSQKTPQIIQRRFSICGSLPAERITNSPNPTQTASNVNKPSNHQYTSQIQISEPVSLNKNAVNMANNKSMNNNAKEQLEEAIQATYSSSTKNKELNNIDPTEGISSKEQEEMPIIETAGTITADTLDPLYVKQTKIKSEPLDD